MRDAGSRKKGWTRKKSFAEASNARGDKERSRRLTPLCIGMMQTDRPDKPVPQRGACLRDEVCKSGRTDVHRAAGEDSLGRAGRSLRPEAGAKVP